MSPIYGPHRAHYLRLHLRAILVAIPEQFKLTPFPSQGHPKAILEPSLGKKVARGARAKRPFSQGYAEFLQNCPLPSSSSSHLMVILERGSIELDCVKLILTQKSFHDNLYVKKVRVIHK